jgi:DNA-binding NarL/FixJ family response regulator
VTAATAPIGVMVIDDNDLVGESIARWAHRQSETVRWLGWTDDPAAAVALVSERRPDVVLLDIDMPGVDTFALVGRLRAQHPEVRVVMLTGHVREDFIDRAADAGAMGYIVKDELPKDILALASRAAAGEFVLSTTARNIVRRRGGDEHA